MKHILMALLISMAILPARAQFFKKLKEETTQRLKEKMETKKSMKIDETTEKASTKAMSVPDSVVQKTARAMKSKKQKNGAATDSTTTTAPIPADTSTIRPFTAPTMPADTATQH